MDETHGRMRVAVCGLAAVAAIVGGCAKPRWQQRVEGAVTYLGHRNWIVVADAAYPAQRSPGISTAVTRADHLEVVKAVLDTVDRAPHVRAKVYVDAEMQHVPEKYAPGIGQYRSRLETMLKGRPVEAVPHEKLIARLDEAAKTFKVIVLKTDLALPYTSVFIELDCGYWSPEAEAALRKAMASAAGQ